MKTTTPAAVLALLIGNPLVTSAAEVAQNTNRALAYPVHSSATHHPGSSIPSAAPRQPEFIGPYELHNGLLPNGLAPNPLTFG